MSMQGQEFKLGEHVYTVCPFVAEHGLEILFELMQYTSGVGDILKGLNIPEDINFDNILDYEDFLMDVIAKILQGLPNLFSRKSVPFIKELVEFVTVDGKPLRQSEIFNSIFACNYSELLILIAKVIKINYVGEGQKLKDFFTGLLGKAKTMLPSKE
jgi:hypothetical protein